MRQLAIMNQQRRPPHVHVYSIYHEIHIHVCIHSYTCIHSITRFTFTSVFTGTCVFILSRDSHSRLYNMCIHSITRFTFTSVFTGTCVFILSRDSHSRLVASIDGHCPFWLTAIVANKYSLYIYIFTDTCYFFRV